MTNPQPGPSRRPALIADMDGTLCDVRTIRHFVDRSRSARRDFDSFHSHSINCPPFPAVVAAVEEARARGDAILIVSAREEKWALVTALWLQENGIAYDEMFLRPAKDYRPDAVIKAEIAEVIRHRYDVKVALEDKPELVAVWNRVGIPVRLVSADGQLGEQRVTKQK